MLVLDKLLGPTATTPVDHPWTLVLVDFELIGLVVILLLIESSIESEQT